VKTKPRQRGDSVQVRECEPADIELLASRLRQRDLADVRELHGDRSPVSVLQEWAEHSRAKWTVSLGGRVIAMFGAARLPTCGESAVVWMLCAREIERHWKAVTTLAPGYIARMLFDAPQLVNAVSARNASGVAWLQKLGFTVLPPQRFGSQGQEIRPFFRKAAPCALQQ
jgi:hypothetical protein